MITYFRDSLKVLGPGWTLSAANQSMVATGLLVKWNDAIEFESYKNIHHTDDIDSGSLLSICESISR